MNIGWRTKYILALSEDFLIHRCKLSGTMGLAHGFHLSNKATNTFYKLVFVAGVISLLVNVFGLYAHLGNLFHWGGPSSVEYIGNQ